VTTNAAFEQRQQFNNTPQLPLLYYVKLFHKSQTLKFTGKTTKTDEIQYSTPFQQEHWLSTTPVNVAAKMMTEAEDH